MKPSDFGPRLSWGLNVGCAFCLLCFNSGLLKAQGGFARRRSTISARLMGASAKTWAIERATLVESFEGIGVVLTIKNVSARPVESAVFYAEYFDGKGRVCFTSLFNLANNRMRSSGPVLPGARRDLLDSSYDVVPTAQPRLLKLYVVQESPKAAEPSGSARVVVRRPVTLQPMGIPASAAWQSLCVGSRLAASQAPIVDLALAMAHVNAAGRLVQLQVIATPAAEPYISWLESLGTHLEFKPATHDNVATASNTLILVRALAHGWGQDQDPYAPWSAPWVRRYVSAAKRGVLAPLNVLLLEGPPGAQTGVMRSDIRECLEYLGGGSEWSVGAGVFGAPPPQPPGKYFQIAR
jgi:hypothetical protein